MTRGASEWSKRYQSGVVEKDVEENSNEYRRRRWKEVGSTSMSVFVEAVERVTTSGSIGGEMGRIGEDKEKQFEFVDGTVIGDR